MIGALVASGWLKLRPVGASSSSLLCSALADICKRSRFSTMGKLWRHCEFTTTLSVRAGFIAKSANVEVFERKDGRYIQIYATAEWLCRAVSAVPRGCSLLRDMTFLDNLKSAVSRPEFQYTGDAFRHADDPMEELLSANRSALAGHAPDVSAKKRKRRSEMLKHGSEYAGTVKIMDVLKDLKVFPAEEREQMNAATVTMFLRMNKQRQLYVLEDDLSTLLLVLRRLAERHGVKHVDLDASALAESEWFDCRSSRWHWRRPGASTAILSTPVRRTDPTGSPLSKDAYVKAKDVCLRSLKMQNDPAR